MRVCVCVCVAPAHIVDYFPPKNGAAYTTPNFNSQKISQQCVLLPQCRTALIVIDTKIRFRVTRVRAHTHTPDAVSTILGTLGVQALGLGLRV